MKRKVTASAILLCMTLFLSCSEKKEESISLFVIDECVNRYEFFSDFVNEASDGELALRNEKFFQREGHKHLGGLFLVEGDLSLPRAESILNTLNDACTPIAVVKVTSESIPLSADELIQTYSLNSENGDYFLRTREGSIEIYSPLNDSPVSIE